MKRHGSTSKAVSLGLVTRNVYLVRMDGSGCFENHSITDCLPAEARGPSGTGLRGWNIGYGQCCGVSLPNRKVVQGPSSGFGGVWSGPDQRRRLILLE